MKALALILLVAVACAPGWNAPISPAPSPGYPCGKDGVSCGNHMCCDSEDVCGAGETCPKGMCCFESEDGKVGAHLPRPQWKELR